MKLNKRTLSVILLLSIMLIMLTGTSTIFAANSTDTSSISDSNSSNVIQETSTSSVDSSSQADTSSVSSAAQDTSNTIYKTVEKDTIESNNVATSDVETTSNTNTEKSTVSKETSNDNSLQQVSSDEKTTTAPVTTTKKSSTTEKVTSDEATTTNITNNVVEVETPTANTTSVNTLKTVKTATYNDNTIYVTVDGNGDGITVDTPTNIIHAFDIANANYQAGTWTINLAGGVYKFTMNLYVNSNINLIGSTDGTTTILDGQGKTRIFYMGNTNGLTKTFSISNINFTNAYVAGNGVTGMVSCVGGAIFVEYGTLIAENCNFTNNVANSNSNSKAAGGAIAWYGHENQATSSNYIKLDNCNFIDNSAKSYGGALRIFCIDAKSESLSKAYITNCNFTNNIAYGAKDQMRGGAINIHNIEGTIENCNFINNTAGESGGAIRADYLLTIKNTVFDGNKILGQGTAGQYEGTAIYNNNGKDAYYNGNFYAQLVLDNCTFANHQSNYNGTVYASGKCDIIIKDNTLFENNSANYGGVIFNEGGVIQVTDSTFNNNTATYYGGAIYNAGGTVTTENAYFNNNKVLDQTSGSGGAIYNSNSNAHQITISSTQFNNNSAVNGGAIYTAVGTTLNILDNSIFNNNTAVTGGSIYISKGTGSIIVKDSKFINGSASDKGGAIYYLGSTVNIQDNQFTNIYAGNETLNLEGIGTAQMTVTGNTYTNSSIGFAELTIVAPSTAKVNDVVTVTITHKLLYPNYYDSDIFTRGDYTVYIDGQEYKVTEDGATSYTVIPTKAGEIVTNITSSLTSQASNKQIILVELTNTQIVLDTIDVNPTLTNVIVKATVTDANGKLVNSGIVTFEDGNGQTIKATVENGIATVTLNYNKQGKYTVIGTYSDPNGAYNTNTTNTIAPIIPIATTTNVVNVETGITNTDITVTATIKDANGNNVQSGNVTFTDGNGNEQNVRVVDGVATITVKYSDDATYSITATYNGDDTYKTSNGNSAVTINIPNTNIETSPAQGTTTTPATVTVTVKDENGKTVTTGNVTFIDEIGNTITVPVNTDGTATIPYTAETKGNYTITVNYNDESGNYNKSTTTVKVEIIPTEVQIIPTDVSGTVGTPTDINVTIKDVNGKTVTTGTVTFTDENGNIIGTATVNSNGTATVPYTADTKGYKTFNVSYTDSTGKYNDSTGNTYATIASIPTTTIITDVINTPAGSPIKLNTTVNDINGNPVTTGNVTFTYKNGVTQTVEVIDGKATTTGIVYINTGSDVVNVAYTDNSGKYSDSTNTTTVYTTSGGLYVNATVLDPTPATGNIISPTTLTVNVYDGFGKAVTTGNVTFYDENGKELGTATVENGVATISYQFDKTGGYTISVKYTDLSGNYPSANGELNTVISPVGTNVVVSPISNTTLTNNTITVHVTDANGNAITSGTVTIDLGNGTTVEANIVNGVATTIVNYNTKSDYTITATYNGNGTYSGNTNTSTATITPIGTTTTTSPISGKTKSDIVVTATVTDANGDKVQSGSATFTDNNGLSKTVNVVNGIATITVNYDTIGDYTMSVVYKGDDTYDPSNYDLSKIDLVEGVVPIDDGTHTGGNSEEDGHADNTITDTPTTDTTTTDNVVSDNTSTTDTTTTITDTPTTDTTTTTTVTDNTNNNQNNQNTITENPTENNTTATTITEDTTTTNPIDNTIIDDTPTTGNNTVIDDTPTIDTPTENNTVIDDTPTNDTPVNDNTSTNIIDATTPANNNTIDTENTTTPTDTPTDTNTTTDANTTDVINNDVNTNTTVNPSNTTETTNNTEVTPDVTTPTTDVTENATATTPATTATTQTATATATTPATTAATATATQTASQTATATATTAATATTGQTATATSDNTVNDNTGVTDTGASDNGATDQSSNTTDNGNNNVISEDSGITTTSYNNIQRRVKLRSFFTAD